jgi:hypothetical protein
LRLGDELNQARLKAAFDAGNRCDAVPAVALLPALHGRALDLQHFGNLWHGKTLPVKQRCLPSRVMQQGCIGGNGH